MMMMIIIITITIIIIWWFDDLMCWWSWLLDELMILHGLFGATIFDIWPYLKTNDGEIQHVSISSMILFDGHVVWVCMGQNH